MTLVSVHKSRNQREGVYCGKSHGVHLRYGSSTHGFKHFPLGVRYISNVIGKIESFRFIMSS